MLKFTSPVKERLVKLICAQGVPFGAAMKALRSKDIKLNGKRQSKDCLCFPNDEIKVYVSLPVSDSEHGESEVAADKNSLANNRLHAFKTIYSDENVAVVIKPQGVSFEDFEKIVSEKYKTAEAVHRLDVNTFGLMIFALNGKAKKELDFGFKNRTFDKYYIAEVAGTPEPPKAVLTAYLEKNAENSTVYIHEEKKTGDVKIVTEYRKIARFCEFYGGYLKKVEYAADAGQNDVSPAAIEKKSDLPETSLVEVKLVTGKTHQIRAHLAFAGMPIIGDDKYGNRALNKKMKVSRQRLCSYKLVLHFLPASPLSYLDGKTFAYFD